MKKLIIICEGQTEQKFCDKLLKPYFRNIDIEIHYPLIAHSGGGIVKWPNLKQEIELHNSTDETAFITTFIDYYGIQPCHAFPDWNIAIANPVKNTRMQILEDGMSNSLALTTQTRFIPYIQLHEFEALIFSDFAAFQKYYAPPEFNSVVLAQTCLLAPESINDGVTTAPSKRLKQNIPIYDKVNDGPELAEIIGLNVIRSQCPRFHNWLSRLENI